MMATPDDFEDFAAGFSLSEEIVRSPYEIQHLEVVRHGQGVELQITVPADVGERWAARGRQLAGRTGCGLCGVETISEVLREPRTVTWRQPMDAAALWRAEADLGARQEYNRATGAMHAAAWCTFDGTIRVVREDVGRHNALDKVIGALAREHIDASTGFLIMTSRASYELVQKAAVAGIPLLAAVSRPTGLAIRLAEAANVTLIGLLRGIRPTCMRTRNTSATYRRLRRKAAADQSRRRPRAAAGICFSYSTAAAVRFPTPNF